jgi:hypothetical protein
MDTKKLPATIPFSPKTLERIVELFKKRDSVVQEIQSEVDIARDSIHTYLGIEPVILDTYYRVENIAQGFVLIPDKSESDPK